MKTMLLSASALVLILSAPALAAPHDQGGGPGGRHGGGHGGGGHPAAAAAPAGHAGGAAHGGGGHHGGGGAGGANILNGGGMSGPSHTPAGNTATPHAHGGHGNGHGTGALNPLGAGGSGGHDSRTHAGRGHNSAFDALRRAFNAPRHYHYRGGSYHQPAGWRYQRWAIGAFLPSLYWSNSYWIGDYNDYGLDNPPPGTVWVRYGDDALLIDRDSGEVIQVIYGIFY